MRFLSGETAPVLARLTTEMQEAADALEYEQAARLRDRLSAVRKAAETQQMVSERPEDLDVVGIAEDELEAAVQVFYVRRGRVVGRKGFVADKVEDLTRPQLVGRVLEELYGAPGAEVPRRVLVPEMPDDVDVHTAWLTGLRGGPVQLAVPLRGDKRALHQTVTRNATEDLARHRLKRAGDHNARARALTELQSALGLHQAPLRIECFDMSHLQGTELRGVDGGVRGRVGQEVRLPPVQGQQRAGQRRLRGHGGGAAPAPPQPAGRAGAPRRRARRRGAGATTSAAAGPPAAAASPTRPSCSCSTAARGSSGSGSGSSKSWGSAARSSWRRWPSSSRRCSARA